MKEKQQKPQKKISVNHDAHGYFYETLGKMMQKKKGYLSASDGMNQLCDSYNEQNESS